MNPHCTTRGFRSFSTVTVLGSPSSPSSVTIVLLKLRVGIATPKAPVSATGLSHRRLSGRSPNPLPKKSCGVTTSKDSAPTRLLPVPPTSQDTPAESSVSCSALFQ